MKTILDEMVASKLREVEAARDRLPESELVANPNLTQNPGY